MRLFPNTIDRNRPDYRERHYRAHWQPIWAIIGLVLCTLLIVSLGWGAVYDLCATTPGVTKQDSIVDLIAAYLGVGRRPPFDVDFMDATDALQSQHCSSVYMWYTKSYIRLRSSRIRLSGINGFPWTCLMSQTPAVRQNAKENWELFGTSSAGSDDG